MANVQHSTLTGASLHEPKGVAAQAASKVYISDGAGSGAWTATSTIPGIFGTNFFHAQHQGSAGSISNGAWTNRNLNTIITNGISGVGLTNPSVTGLTAGSYIIQAFGGVSGTGSGTPATAALRIQYGEGTIIGPSTSFAYPGGTSLFAGGKFTLASPGSVSVQTYVNGAGTFAEGTVLGFGTERYLDVFLWKIT
jgi:hypothetical protein